MWQISETTGNGMRKEGMKCSKGRGVRSETWATRVTMQPNAYGGHTLPTESPRCPIFKFYRTFCSIRNVAHFRNQSMFSTLIHLILFTANCGKFKTFSGHSKHSKLEVIVTRKYLIQWINIEFVLLRLCFIKRHRFNPFSFYVFRHQATNRCQCWSDKIPLTAPVHFNASK